MGLPPPSAAPGPAAEPVIPWRAFEGLFVHGLEPTPALREALRGVGVDLDAPQGAYPAAVWHAALEVTRQQRCPELPKEEAWRRLGRVAVVGFTRTVLGRLFSAAAPFFGPHRVLARVPTYLSAVHHRIQVRAVAVGLQTWELHVTQPDPLPTFIAGCVEQIVEVAGGVAEVSVVREEGEHFTLRVTWRRPG